MEIVQPYFTRKNERPDGSIHTLSRIDRVFINLPMAELRDFQCHSHTTGSNGDKSVTSDRIRVRLAIECPRTKQRDHLAIQWWHVQHPFFVSAQDEEHRNAVFDADPFVSLEQFKEAAFKTRPNSRQAFLACTPTTRGATLVVACSAFCALTGMVWLPLSRSVVGHRPLLLDAFMPNPLYCISFSSALQFC